MCSQNKCTNLSKNLELLVLFLGESKSFSTSLYKCIIYICIIALCSSPFVYHLSAGVWLNPYLYDMYIDFYIESASSSRLFNGNKYYQLA